MGPGPTLLEALAPEKGHSLERSHETGLGRSARHQCQVLFYGPAVPAVFHLPASEALCGMQQRRGISPPWAPSPARLPPPIHWLPAHPLGRPPADVLHVSQRLTLPGELRGPWSLLLFSPFRFSPSSPASKPTPASPTQFPQSLPRPGPAPLLRPRPPPPAPPLTPPRGPGRPGTHALRRS